MHPNRDEIIAAKRLLADAGYLCVHIAPDAEWTTDLREIAGPGIAVQLHGVEARVAEQQMLAIKSAYGKWPAERW